MLSRDGKRHGYIESLPNQGGHLGSPRMRPVIDGTAGKEYDSLNGLLFSPSGEHVAVMAMHGGSSFAIVDGKESNELFQVERFQFSPDGSRYAYEARFRSDQRYHVVIDGVASEPLQEIVKGSVTFSPDGKRVVYAAYKGMQEQIVVLDGKTYPLGLGTFGGHEGPSAGPIVFSQDSKHIAFIGAKQGKPTVMLDMAEASDTFYYNMPVFSPDGRHFAYVGRPSGAVSKYTVFVDGKPGPTVEKVFTQRAETFHFLENGKLELLAIKDGQVQRITTDVSGSNVEHFAANAGKVVSDKPTDAAESNKSTKTIDDAKQKIQEKLKKWNPFGKK